jgi:hypothetical protein
LGNPCGLLGEAIRGAGLDEPLAFNTVDAAQEAKDRVLGTESHCEMTRLVLVCVRARRRLRICFRIAPFLGVAVVLSFPSLLAFAAVLGFLALEAALAYS